MKDRAGIQDLNIFKFVSENPNDAHFLVGRDAQFLYVNKTACKMLGYAQKELLSLGVPDVDAVYGIEKFHELFDRVQQGPIPPIETINKRKDGSEFPSEISVTGYLVEGKQYMFAALRDITGRKNIERVLTDYHNRLEQMVKERTTELTKANARLLQEAAEHKKTAEELRQASKEWRTTFNSLSDFISVHDNNFRFLKVNKALADFLGKKPDELVGKHCYKELCALDEPRPDCPHVLSHRSKKPVTKERYFPNFNKYLLLVASPLLDEEGEMKGVVHYIKDITERKLAEEKLRENEERFRAAAMATTDLIWEGDVDNGVLDWFGDIDGILGYSPGEFPRTIAAHMEGVHPKDQEKLIGSVGEAVNKGEDFFAEYRMKCRDGSYRVWEERGRAVHFEDGKATRWVGAITDITERRKAEKELREASIYIDTMADALIVLNMQKEVIKLNKAAIELWGYTAEEMYGSSFEELFPKEEHKKHYEEMDASVRTGSVRPFEATALRKNGEEVPVILSGTIMKDDRGEPAGFVGVCRDITDRKRSEGYIRDILDSIGEGLIVINIDYKITSANKAFCEMNGLSAEEIKGKYCYEVSHHSTKPCYELGSECPVKTTFETGEPHTSVHIHYDKEGTPHLSEVSAYPMKDRSGDVLSVIETIIDITEKNKLEEQVRHSQKMQTVGQLAGGVAHDFNNILSAIISYGHILLMKMSDEEQKKIIQKILDSADRAAGLTKNLLAFSRKQIMNPLPVNLNEIVKSVIKLLSRVIGDDIEVRTLLADEDLTIKADSSQMDQVLLNLATNARDAMPEGGVLTLETGTIEIDAAFVRMHGYGKHGRYALLSITDTGIGMDENTRGRVFEPFFTTKEVVEGAGLGLSMVYGIIKEHSGFINVYSEPGKGTTIRVYIPLLIKEVEDAVPEKTGVSAGGTETVLLVEDDVDVRKVTKQVLEEFGYTVIEAVDGEDAVERFRANSARIQLLILDVVMPKKSGKAAYDEIKTMSPDVKALFMSGYTTDSIPDKELFGKSMNFISKPVIPVELHKKIREVLDG